MQNKLTKDEVLNHFNILYDDLPESIQLQLDKFFPIQYNELNSKQYKEYYELFKQNSEWEVEHDNHKEGFDGEGNSELEKAITEMVDNDDTLFF